MISLPDQNDIQIIQRRQYVRVEADIDVAIHTEVNSFTTITTDLSSGLSFIIPYAYELEQNDQAEIWLVLPMSSNHYFYINTTAKLVRLDEQETVWKDAFKFISLKPSDQEIIMRYCFEKQLKAKKDNYYKR